VGKRGEQLQTSAEIPRKKEGNLQKKTGQDHFYSMEEPISTLKRSICIQRRNVEGREDVECSRAAGLILGRSGKYQGRKNVRARSEQSLGCPLRIIGERTSTFVSLRSKGKRS